MQPESEMLYDGSESDCAASSTSEDTPLDVHPSNNPADDTDNDCGNHSSGELMDKRRSSLCKECQDQDKDSGIEFSGEDSFVLPDKELVSKIINQVEFYFSNENILKDPFLLKHVRRNKEGYVSLKLIATFRKVKTFTKDWRVVAYSLRQSSNLEVNELNTKVRRIEPLPNHDETTPSRTIILHNLSFEKVTMENVGDLVSKYGDVVLIRILRPGLSVPSDMKDLKKFMTKHPELAETVCAAVEFEKQQYASNAMKDLNSKKDWRGVRAVPLVEKSDKTSVSSAPGSHPKQPKEAPVKKESIRNAPIKKRKNKKVSDASQRSHRRSEDHTSCSESEQFSPEIRRRSSGSISSGYISSSPRFFGDYFERRNSSGCAGMRQNNNNTNSPATPRRASCMARPIRSSISGHSESECSSSPWVQRRIMASRENSSGNLHSRTLVPEGVLRLPYGPDGSNGFQKPRAVTVA